MKIIINSEGDTQVFDDKGTDILKMLTDHGVYLTNMTLRMSPGGVSLQATLNSVQYVIETPNSLMNIVEALHSIEE